MTLKTLKTLKTPRRTSEVEVPGTDVFEAALERVRWLFDEFDGDVAVSSSGGKDSTVCIELAARVAAERGDPPLRVTFLDQECEFQGTVDYQRSLAARPDIDFRWYQIPFRLENSTNAANPWLNVWDPALADEPPIPEGGNGWVRAKEPYAFTENTFGYDHFYNLLSTINFETAPCVLSGMRAEESPNRRMTLTSRPVYKWVTWASYAMHEKGKRAGRYRFHAIWDWSYRDVWKAILDNGWDYNVYYDYQYRYGVPLRKMRVSNFHHETALHALEWLQEVEPETWEAATKRLEGLSTFSHLADASSTNSQLPTKLPYMFDSWDEYSCYLIENLIPESDRPSFYRHRDNLVKYCGPLGDARWGRVLARSVIGGDVWGTTVDNWINANRYKVES